MGGSREVFRKNVRETYSRTYIIETLHVSEGYYRQSRASFILSKDCAAASENVASHIEMINEGSLPVGCLGYLWPF
jgi:hypothetical protein